MKRAAGFLAAPDPPEAGRPRDDFGNWLDRHAKLPGYSPPYGDVTISAELAATETPDGLNLSYLYPKVPQANSEGLFALTEDGAVLDGGRITVITRTEDGLIVTTEEACWNDNTPAASVRDYSFSPHAFAAKRVRFAGDPETFLRNVCRFTRP